MNVFEVGVGKISLTKNHFVRSGGQADVYAKDNKAYKIYNDKSYIIPTSKIQELSPIDNEDIIKPLNILLDNHDNPIGYSMRFVDNNIVLCQLFTKIFKNKNGITPKHICNLITDMKNKIAHVHSKNVIIVDLNEMNFLVQQKDYSKAFFIDVDSYQTKSFPATALMESIRDRHTKGFSELTDWFSFGIISCYLLIGIHPFRGKHPQFQGNSPDILDKRMKANVSIFNKDTTIPITCSPLDTIPKSYISWYKDLFENGKRCAPPDIDGITIIVKPHYSTIDYKTDLIITQLFKYNDVIVKYSDINGYRVCITKDGGYINDKKEDSLRLSSEVGITPKFNRIIVSSIINNKVELYDAYFGKPIEIDINAQQLFSYGGRIYAKNSDNLYELDFMELPTKTLSSASLIGNVLENATQIFDGVVFQNLLGATFCSIFPQKNKHVQIKMEELKEYVIINAKFENDILMVIGKNIKNSQTDKFIFQIKDNIFCKKIENVIDDDINFTVLDNGICVNYIEEGVMELFHKNNINGQNRFIKDNAIKDVRLYKNGTKVLFVQDTSVYLVETQKNKEK